ncbi:hypothetical protein ASC66_05745 [Leifsonia sp. Root4]|uniref:HAAS signaling domain-containing protein n=1 Tax=Leifsonia sp. Root4 TaxID=1736525 RepID=UPI0006F20760|nr:hypothetical protein [Leifsonia sp. Root4]KQW08395.1 hypothetical protein ASC66_05745 [Leifsonia sp. Root4]
MTDATLAPAARDYLDRLDAALAGIDASTRADILSGVREVLIGRDADAVAARIRELGDPDFIAAEARAVPVAAEVSPDGTPRARRPEPAGLAIVAAVLVMIGGALVPILGAVVGYVLVWISTVWTTRQKLIATLLPVGTALALALVLVAVRLGLDPSGEAGAANPQSAISPTMVLWNGIVLIAAVQLMVGIWLLVLARRSWAARA